MAAVQIVVYVGGIVVLIIFSIFLTQRSGIPMPVPLRSRLIPAAVLVLAGLAITGKLILENEFKHASAKPMILDVKEIGRQMLSMDDYGFVLPFELVSMLLLAALIGCIVIAMKLKPKEMDEKKIELKAPGIHVEDAKPAVMEEHFPAAEQVHDPEKISNGQEAK
jgi:NADH-quinone oxidoreductase subunit J